MKIGILFGGQSREREVSLAGAKTVLDCMDISLFEPVLIFVDGKGHFIKLEASVLEKAAEIRDFYPPQQASNSPIYAEALGDLTAQDWEAMANQVGVFLHPHDFKAHFDFAFLMTHGGYAEDGTIQGLLEWYGIPYSGCGVLSSAIGIDKHFQKSFVKESNPSTSITKREWLSSDKAAFFEKLKQDFGLPLVIKAPYQGSSIGVSILKADNLDVFKQEVQKCFFVKEITKSDWQILDNEELTDFFNKLTAFDKGIGLPAILLNQHWEAADLENNMLYQTQDVKKALDQHFKTQETAFLTSLDSEELLFFERCIAGKEFSCGVIQTESGKSVVLPPTEIISPETFDFDAKYKAGGSRKVIPIAIPDADVRRIQAVCQEHFEAFKYGVCARIDGFFTESGEIFLIDTNTLPGMSPTSLIFRQAAEIGLAPTHLITYLIYQSLLERCKVGKKNTQFHYLAKQLSKKMAAQLSKKETQKRHLLIIENGEESLSKVRTRYNELLAKGEFVPLAVLKTQDGNYASLPISFLLKPNIAEIEMALYQAQHTVIAENIETGKSLTAQFVGVFEPLPQAIDVGAFELVTVL